jgi:hypothetical protein
MKAQLFSLEFIMTFFIFLGLFYMADASWGEIVAARDATWDLHQKAVLLSHALISSPGEPVLWNNTTVRTVGFSYTRNVLDPEKLSAFVSLASTDYEKAKTVLGTQYDFYLAVRDSGGILFETEKKPDNYTKVVSVTRECMLQETQVTLVLVLGEE